MPRICVANPSLCIAQGDDKRFLVTVQNEDGTDRDISAASEITFIIATRVSGTTKLTKTLTGSTITLSNNSAFYFDVSDTESAALGVGRLYYECQITNADASKQTVMAGRFDVQDTTIGD